MFEMPHRKRKVRKQRGSRTHGYGRVGQHRGGGQRGGRGKTGFHKHKWSYSVKHDPNRFGKHGFNPANRKNLNVINVGELDEQISSLLGNEQAKKVEIGVEIHLNNLGYDKLLGRGKVTQPLFVQIDSYSESAAEKIEKAGGKIIATNQ
jgi:large subunit ribosomal protein L15